MNRTAKLVLGFAIALLVAFGSGWLWGSTGRWDAEARLRDIELQLHLTQARGGLLQARIDVFEVNFGQASRHLVAARSALRAASAELATRGRDDARTKADSALASLGQAQQLVGRLDQSANARAAQAVAQLDEVLAGVTAR